MSLKFNTLYDFDNINNDNNNNNIDNNIKSKTFKEKEGMSDLTKNFIRNALNEKYMNKEDQKLRINPSNFNIDNQNLFTMFKLEYTLIDDFLIRTKLDFTRNIFNNEMKKIIKPLIPLEDGELSSLLGININELSSIRFKWNNNSQNSEDIINSTYLYYILNKHTKIMKIDSECQTENKYNNIDMYQNQNIDNILKRIEDKYEKKVKEKNDFFNLEKKFVKYKEELDSRYEKELKDEIDRFKTVELSQMRIEENKKYLQRIEKLREEYQEEYNKKYEEIKKLRKELQERESNLYKEFEERNIKLKRNYEEKEKILEEKRMFLEKKYKNEKNETSVQIVKFNEELEDLKKSFYKSEKDKKMNNIKKNEELNPVINSEINNLKNQIEEIKNTLLKRNNYIKEEDKTNYENKKSIKPSKKSVINNLEIFAKNNNYNNNINLTNKSKSSNSPSGSGAYNSNSYNNINPKIQTKKERMKMIEKLEEEEFQITNKFREEFMKIIHDDQPILSIDKNFININRDINDMKIAKYKPNDIENININNNYNNNYINQNKNENNENNLEKNNIDNINKNLNNNINNNINNDKTIKNENERIEKDKKENNIGGFNLEAFNKNIGNNIYNYPIKGESESAIEENIEGENNNIIPPKKENNITKKNNIINSNKYQDQTNPIKEEFEGESGGSNNNSKEYNNNNKNINMNVNKSNNKFNNYDLGEYEYNNDSKNDEVKNEGEIEEEIINYGISGGIDDLSGKRKDKDNKIISASISGIAKKQYEISESAGGFRGLLQLQGHGGNFKEEKDEFEFSKGKNNNNINNNMNQRTESGKISEEIESDGPF